MKILNTKSGGFCFGVQKAIDSAKSLVGKNNYVLGEIIHNESVIEQLKKLGIKTINSLDEVDFIGGETLLIRTHGEPKNVLEKAQKLNLNIIDCTCPFVKKIQNIVSKYYNDGYKIAIIGNKDHPEIIGVNGWCENSAIITESAEELSAI